MKVAPSSLTRCSLAVITVCLETRRSSLILVVEQAKGICQKRLLHSFTKTSIPPKGSHASIRNFSAKKAFTPSHRARFCMIFNGFECEGLDFQVFTSTVAFLPRVSADFRVVFRCEGLRFPPFTIVHRPCECFAAQVNTLKSKPSHSNQLNIRRKRALCEWVNTFLGK